MKIAIHHKEGSFSDRWIEFCKVKNIDYKVVNAYSSDIISELKDCNGFMWHWNHTDYKAQIFANHLTKSIENRGVKVFPGFETSWHFDDKIAQKYLFESSDLPFINSYVFYDKKEALDWISKTTFPKVFKLRGGASSSNVSLIKNRNQAIKKINIAFNRGFKLVNRNSFFNRKWNEFKKEKNLNSFLKLNKGIYKYIFPDKENNLLPIQKGYVYFQDFIKNNDFDIRIVTIGNRSLGFRRFNSKNDFRASGSGLYDFNPELVDINAVKLAFKIAKKLNLQSVACDFIYHNNKLKIVEISYGFLSGLSPDIFKGYWDNNMKWHEGGYKLEYWIIEDFVNSLKN